MKAVLISVNPTKALDILDGKISILINKKLPKLEPPYDMYLYCSHGKCLYEYEKKYGFIGDSKSNRIISSYPATLLNGKVIARVTVKKVAHCTTGNFNCIKDDDLAVKIEDIQPFTGLTMEELQSYEESNWKDEGVNQFGLYALQFTNLKIFEKPKEIGEFFAIKSKRLKVDKTKPRSWDNAKGYEVRICNLTKAPTNFCYIESE